MQFQVNAAGQRIYPSEFKRKVLDDLRGGQTPHELGRRYGVPIQNIVNWRRSEKLGGACGAWQIEVGEQARRECSAHRV